VLGVDINAVPVVAEYPRIVIALLSLTDAQNLRTDRCCGQW